MEYAGKWRGRSLGGGLGLSVGNSATMRVLQLENSTETVVDAQSTAEEILTQERYQRIRTTILEELQPTNDDESVIDFLLFQEITVDNAWDAPARDAATAPFLDTLELLYEPVPCRAYDGGGHPGTVQHVYVRRDAGWRPTRSLTLRSPVIDGGCLTEFVVGCDEDTNNSATHCSEGNTRPSSLILVNLHGSSSRMRDPALRQEGIFDLWQELESQFNNTNTTTITTDGASSWQSRIVLCGDWNTQLSDLIEPFREAANSMNKTATSSSSSSSRVLFEPVVGLLDNATAMTTQGYPFFSTNHEDGFLAQYDGCLFFRTMGHGSQDGTRSDLELDETSWNLTGFMPKGRDGRLSGDPPLETPMYNNFTYSRGNSDNKNEGAGVYLNGVLLPGSRPSSGLSDHLRIYTTLRINTRYDDSSAPNRETTTSSNVQQQVPPKKQKKKSKKSRK